MVFIYHPSINLIFMAKKKTTRKPRVARTRNAGTMTEAAFWSMIRSALMRS